MPDRSLDDVAANRPPPFTTVNRSQSARHREVDQQRHIPRCRGRHHRRPGSGEIVCGTAVVPITASTINGAERLTNQTTPVRAKYQVPASLRPRYAETPPMLGHPSRSMPSSSLHSSRPAAGIFALQPQRPCEVQSGEGAQTSHNGILGPVGWKWRGSGRFEHENGVLRHLRAPDDERVFDAGVEVGTQHSTQHVPPFRQAVTQNLARLLDR